eukprot:11302184-Ditylum_brightwellii.AAC.1
MSETLGQLVIGKRRRRDPLCFEEGATACKGKIGKKRRRDPSCFEEGATAWELRQERDCANRQ